MRKAKGVKRLCADQHWDILFCLDSLLLQCVQQRERGKEGRSEGRKKERKEKHIFEHTLRFADKSNYCQFALDKQFQPHVFLFPPALVYNS